jgi:hypothetical protein
VDAANVEALCTDLVTAGMIERTSVPLLTASSVPPVRLGARRQVLLLAGLYHEYRRSA